jgi:hypothetical protein
VNYLQTGAPRERERESQFCPKYETKEEVRMETGHRKENKGGPN